MFSDRRMILGALVVLIGALLFAVAGPFSNAGILHEDHEVYEHEHEAEEHEAEEHAEHEGEHESHAREHAYHADYDYTQIVEKTFKAESGQSLWLDTEFGKVTVRGDGGREVVVTVIKGIDDVDEDEAEEAFERFDLDFDQSSDGVTVEGEYDGDRSWGRRKRLQVAFEISVPRTFDVEVKTAGGSVTAEDLRGETDLHTAGGSIRSVDIDGPLTAQTAGGSIKVENIGGPAELHTAGGSITARDVEGSVEAETSGGSITAELMKAPDGPMNLETSAGSITLRLTEDTSIDIDAKASGGRVRTDLDIDREGEESKTRLKGELNGGGPLVTLRTSAGSIKIMKR